MFLKALLFMWLYGGNIQCNELHRSHHHHSTFTRWPKLPESRRGLCASASKTLYYIFCHFLKNKGCFVWACFPWMHQLFLSDCHLSQLTVPPVPSHRKWGIRITPVGYEKGICFSAVGDKIVGGNARAQEKYERKRAHEETRYEV